MNASLLGFVLVCLTAAAGSATSITIAPASPTVIVGDSVTLDVQILGVTDLYAYQFDLSFDPAILSSLLVSEGPFLPSGGATFFLPGSIDNVAGTVSFVANSLLGPFPGVSGSGVLASVQFQAVAQGLSSIALSNVMLLDSTLADLPTSISSGLVTVRPSGAPVPEPGSLLLLGTSMVGLGLRCWRTRPRSRQIRSAIGR